MKLFKHKNTGDLAIIRKEDADTYQIKTLYGPTWKSILKKDFEKEYEEVKKKENDVKKGGE